MFNWLKNWARNAVLSGVGEAMAELGTDPGAPALTLSDIRERLALPAKAEPEAEEPAKKRGK